MKKVSTASIALVLALGTLSPVHAASYAYTSLTYPGALNTIAFGINNEGSVVGSYFDTMGEHGFSLSDINLYSPECTGCFRYRRLRH